MHPTLRILQDLNENRKQCKCLINNKFCTTTISDEAFKAARSILRLPAFKQLDLRYDYADDLCELARLSFCKTCSEKYYDQCEAYYHKLLKWMGKELDDLPMPEITISKPRVYTPSGKADSDGFINTPADPTKDNQGVKYTERIKNIEAEKEELNQQILGLKQQLEHQSKTAKYYLKEGRALYETHEQLKREYAMGEAQWNANKNGLLMRIAELEQKNRQLKQDSHVPRMVDVRELLQVSGAVKVLHDKLSWFLGSHPEEVEEEEEEKDEEEL